jgi:hypothetical protein
LLLYPTRTSPTEESTKLRSTHLIVQAQNKVKCFSELIEKFKKNLSVFSRAESTFEKYSRHLANTELHFECLPTEFDEDQVVDYFNFLQQFQIK